MFFLTALFSLSLFAQSETSRLDICFPKINGDLLNFTVSVAKDRGFFARQGLEVEIHRLDYKFREYRGPFANFLIEAWEHSRTAWSETCELGTLSAGAVLAMSAEQREELIPVSMSFYDAGNDMDLVTGSKSSIRSVKELKGKRIRVTSLPSALALIDILAKYGMKLNEVILRVGSQPEWSMGGLTLGKHEATFTTPPLTPVFVRRGDIRVLQAKVISQHAKTMPGVLLLASRTFAETRAGELAKFRKALAEAQSYIKNHPEAVPRAMETFFNVQRAKQVSLSPQEELRAGAGVNMRNLLDIKSKPQSARAAKLLETYASRLLKLQLLTEAPGVNEWLNSAREF